MDLPAAANGQFSDRPAVRRAPLIFPLLGGRMPRRHAFFNGSGAGFRAGLRWRLETDSTDFRMK
jgi:hypothetical protein